MKGVVFAEVGEPIPREHALAADDQAGTIRRNGVAKSVGAGGQIGFEDGLAIVIKDVGEHASCVKIDAGVECVGMVVEAHGELLEKGEPSEPASWLRCPERR